MEQLNFTIESFEGPLDLLLSLIKKNRMDICNIQIHVIFDQYMEYIHTMEKYDIDIACEFIIMATELMLIKSKMMLPRAAEEESPLERLQMKVMEYAKAKQIGPNFPIKYDTITGPEIIPILCNIIIIPEAFTLSSSSIRSLTCDTEIG